MKNKPANTEEYIVGIYEQNEKILELLERFVESKEDEPTQSVVDIEKLYAIEKVNQLTPREREIIRLLVDGKMNKQISYDLIISTSTVEYHRSNIMKKLDAKNMGQMIKMYIRWEDAMKSEVNDTNFK